MEGERYKNWLKIGAIAFVAVLLIGAVAEGASSASATVEAERRGWNSFDIYS